MLFNCPNCNISWSKNSEEGIDACFNCGRPIIVIKLEDAKDAIVLRQPLDILVDFVKDSRNKALEGKNLETVNSMVQFRRGEVSAFNSILRLLDQLGVQ